MRYTNFTIENYKGINKLELDIDILPDHKIYALVGLNESGKTTILEAINDFEYEVPETLRHLLIPKSSAGGFTGIITIKATLRFNEEDKVRIKEFIAEKQKFAEIILDENLIIQRDYSFDNSKPGQSKSVYYRFIKVKKTKKSKHTPLDDPLATEVWRFIKKNLYPEIIFYRDFLTKFPERIWLETTDIKEREYVSIIQDVLTSINPSYNIEVSLLERLRNPNDANQQALEAVENQIGAKISQVVFNAWSKFQKVSAKEIVAKTGKDGEKFFLKLSVKEGHQTFSLAEKSLGFRWFFTFLLFTEFRKERIKTSGEILFLLDEPASNLHQTAQQSLLDTFQGISSKSRLIYTTHSHHLINPALLDAVYIIKNQGLNLENDPDFNLSMTEIDAYKYKQFVSSHPLQTSYFQPILDVLDYRPGLLEYIKAIVITEGKFDYFTFRYFKEVIFQDLDDSWGFYPGHSATKLDLPISMYEAWGRKYLVLLDADPTGKTQKKRYIRDYSDTDHVFTLADVNSIHDGKNLEVIFSEDELINTCKEFDPTSTKFEKGTFNLGIQKLYSEKQVPEYFTDSTKQYFHEFLELSRG